MTTTKPFGELSEEEATALAEECVRGAGSEDEIRCRLTEAGFNGNKAAITSHQRGPIFHAMIMVWGPKGEVIHV